MKLEYLYRIDYPLFSADAVEGSRAIGFDRDSRIEEQPLGLTFQFTSCTKGLLVGIENDAEQVACQVRDLASLLPCASDYFGFASPVGSSSDLHALVGAELRCIYFGFVAGTSPSHQLLFGVKFEFDTASLVFLNCADEGLYLFEPSARYQEFFAEYATYYSKPVWQEQPELLAQLAGNLP